jgi:O-antigen ligase
MLAAMGRETGHSASRAFMWLLAMLLGGAAAFMAILPWSFDAHPSGLQLFLRNYSFAIPLIEFTFVLCVMRTGFSPLAAVAAFPRGTKLLAVGWFTLMIFTSFEKSDDHLEAAIGTLKIFIETLFILSLIHLRSLSQFRDFTKIWFCVGAGAAVYVLIWTGKVVLVGMSGNDWAFGLPGLINVRHVGHIALASYFAGIFCLFAFQHKSGLSSRWLFPVLFAATGLVLTLWTGSRGPTLAALIGTVLIVSFSGAMRRRLSIYLLATWASAVLVASALPIPHDIYGVFRASGMAHASTDLSGDIISGRGPLWQGTVNKIMQKPLLGWGLEQYSTSGPMLKPLTKHPHNFVLQLLFSGGIIGLIALCLLGWAAMRHWGWPKLAGKELVGTGCVVAMLVYSMYDGALYFSYPIMIFLLALATSIQPKTRPPASDRSDLPDQTKADRATR